MNAPILLSGGRVVDPSQGLDGPADVLIHLQLLYQLFLMLL